MATTKKKPTRTAKKASSVRGRPKPKAKKAAPARKLVALRTRLSKPKLVAELADQVELPRKQVAMVLDELEVVIGRSIKSGSIGEFVWPGLFKVVTVKKKATKARKGVSPFTGEAMVFKAKPASRTVRLRPLKKLKEYAATK